MTSVGQRRWFVEEFPGEGDEPPIWYALCRVLVGHHEYEPGFPVLGEDWEDVSDVDVKNFDTEAEARAFCASMNGDELRRPQ